MRILELAQFERWSTQKARKRLETKWGGPLRMAGETIADDDSESEGATKTPQKRQIGVKSIKM